MTNVSSFPTTNLLNRFKKLRSIIPAITCLIIVSFFLIGGCNNSGSNQVDARTIGEINGAVVPALKQVLTLRNWKEGAPTGDLYLNGSRVATLTDAEKQAINDSYDMGFIVALVNPDIDDILDLHEVLGLNPIFAENVPIDLLAFSRQFNGSGIRYFTMRHHDEFGDPIEPNLNIERVIALGEWAPVASSASSASSASLQLQATSPFVDFTTIADSICHSYIFTYKGHYNPAISADCTPTLCPPDFRLVFSGTVRVWSVHRFEDPSSTTDHYYFRQHNTLTPSSTLGEGALGVVCNKLCAQEPGGFLPCAIAPDGTGAVAYTMNNFTNLSNDVLTIGASAPQTQVGTVTTSNSLSSTVSGNVSYSQDEGAEVGVSDSVSVDHTKSFSAPAVGILNLAQDGPNKNNAKWVWSFTNTPPNTVQIAAFQPLFQWIWQANASTRASGIILNQQFTFTDYPYSCLPPPLESFQGQQAWDLMQIAIPIPPEPIICTAIDGPTVCGPGQRCITDLGAPFHCGPQSCFDKACPGGFQCINENCYILN